MPVDEVRRLGVLGGTFDPIHVGHLRAATAAMAALDLDRVLLLPAGSPWQKHSHSEAEDRFMMVTLAAADHPGLAVSRIELDRKGPTFSADSLRILRRCFPEAALYFIAGTDTLAHLETWHDFDSLQELATFVAVGRRGSGDRLPLIDHRWPAVEEVSMAPVDVSSTGVRARVASGVSIDGLVPDGVADYIRRHGLYLPDREARDG